MEIGCHGMKQALGLCWGISHSPGRGISGEKGSKEILDDTAGFGRERIGLLREAEAGRGVGFVSARARTVA